MSFAIAMGAAAIYAQPEKTPAKSYPGRNGLTQSEITEILQAHNAARSENKLAALTWDCKLAGTAQEWATRRL
jgi:uncharacterized protein YkwD